jgi:hypothetical protein
MFTDNGPDYRCPLCGADITGEIGHKCSDELIDEEWQRRLDKKLEEEMEMKGEWFNASKKRN